MAAWASFTGHGSRGWRGESLSRSSRAARSPGRRRGTSGPGRRDPSARVRDSRVVQIHDVGEANGRLYLVLEYVPGGSLKDRLDGPLPAAAAAALTEKIAGGVAAVHRAGLLHLDLKPSNILLDAEPGAPWESISPKVADFGIARDVDEFRDDPHHTARAVGHAVVHGTRASRIAVASRSGRPRTSMPWGRSFTSCLTGRPPFRAASLAETMDQIRHQEPAPPRRLNPAIPLDLETICATCLRKDPEAALPDRGCPGGRPRALAAGPADHGPTDLDWGTRLAVGSPSSADGRARSLARRNAVSGFLKFACPLASSRERTPAGGAICTRWRRQILMSPRNPFARSASWHSRAIMTVETRECSFRSIMKDPSSRPGARQLELLRRNVLERSAQEQLATVDLLLAEVYRTHGRRQDAARPLFDESIAIWEACIARGADQDVARRQQLPRLACPGTTAV